MTSLFDLLVALELDLLVALGLLLLNLLGHPLVVVLVFLLVTLGFRSSPCSVRLLSFNARVSPPCGIRLPSCSARSFSLNARASVLLFSLESSFQRLGFLHVALGLGFQGEP